jgi:hypothetical protein
MPEGQKAKRVNEMSSVNASIGRDYVSRRLTGKFGCPNCETKTYNEERSGMLQAN